MPPQTYEKCEPVSSAPPKRPTTERLSLSSTTWGRIKTAMDSGDWSGTQQQRGGSTRKVVKAHAEYLLDDLASTPELTLVHC
ncbi:hypothetical protein GN244_ATG04503 [Phytophthora infestans]|uniref:Uncharacterized protein n=1 Tax=Phytophthora infestans TaxID=4787 RepID=A0A833TGP2_PHYIN|nr:hypothetical protein GN244_ATG04503 [Phytophthora infestans]